MMHVGYHLTHRKLQPGDVIAPGQWGATILATGPTHDWFEREQLLEKVRAEHYSDKPSRLLSAYYFPDHNHALHYWVNKAQGDHVYVVYAADPMAPTHHGFMHCLPPLKGFAAEETAHHYWRADLTVTAGKFQTATEEILTTSPLVVMQELLMTPDMFEDPSAVMARPSVDI